MTSPPVPPQAITAAIASLGHHHDVNLWLTAAEGTVGGLLARKKLLTRAVEAAAPHLAAARLDEAQAAAYATGVADGAAAGRERCAQLAEQLGASYSLIDCRFAKCGWAGTPHTHYFAALPAGGPVTSARPPWWWKPWLTPWFAVTAWWHRPRPVKQARP